MRNGFLISLVMLAGVSLTFAASLSAPRSGAHGFAEGSDSILPSVESTPAPQKVALLESLTLTFDSPSLIRLGEVALIRLTVTIEENIKVDLEMNASQLPTVAELGDVFDSYHLIAEARLEMPRLFVSPSNMVSQPIRAGQSITYTWSIPASAVGEYDGTAWFFLRFVPKSGDEKSTGQDSDDDMAAQGDSLMEAVTELPVAAIPVHVRVVSLLGMKGSTARIIGTVGLFASLLIALPLLLDWIYRVRRSSSS